VRCYGAAPAVEPGNSEAHSFEPATVTVHYNPAMNWTLDADGKWQGYTVSDKGACLHTDYGTTERTVPATCGKAGRVDTICGNCGEVISTRELPPTGAHDWGNGVVTTAPTETTPGVRTFTCTVCSDIREETIPATGAHDYQFTKNVAPTCTDGGYDLYTCSGCGATERRNLTDAAGHHHHALLPAHRRVSRHCRPIAPRPGSERSRGFLRAVRDGVGGRAARCRADGAGWCDAGSAGGRRGRSARCGTARTGKNMRLRRTGVPGRQSRRGEPGKAMGNGGLFT